MHAGAIGFQARDGHYFSYVQPFQYFSNTPCDGVNVYSFSLLKLNTINQLEHATFLVLTMLLSNLTVNTLVHMSEPVLF